MLVKHRCGHKVNVPERNAGFVKRTICWECEQRALKAQEEQTRKFKKALRVGGVS